MRLTVERFGLGRHSTLGRILVDGAPGPFSLEDPRRAVKVPGDTCIPEGTYEVVLRTDGRLHDRYAVRFSAFHVGMLWLQNVPNFEGIYFHVGNDSGDTEGCILVGEHPLILPDGEFQVSSSVSAYAEFYQRVVGALYNGEEVTVEVLQRGPM